MGGEVGGILEPLDFVHEELRTSLILLGLLVPEVDLLHEASQEVQLGVVPVEPHELHGVGVRRRRAKNDTARFRGHGVTVAISLVLCLYVFFVRLATNNRSWENTLHISETILKIRTRSDKKRN